jgi:hypothetical protein
MRSVCCCLWIGVVSGCIGLPDSGFTDEGLPFGVFGEMNATRSVGVSLVAPATTQRFVVPVTIEPFSPDARIEAFFLRVEGSVVADLSTDAFAPSSPTGWALVEEGVALRTFSAADAFTEDFRLSLADSRDGVWSTDAGPASAQIELVVSAPADVDFDGFDDDVTVSIGPLRPVVLAPTTGSACTACSCDDLACVDDRCVVCEADADCCADRRCIDGLCVAPD